MHKLLLYTAQISFIFHNVFAQASSCHMLCLNIWNTILFHTKMFGQQQSSLVNLLDYPTVKGHMNMV